MRGRFTTVAWLAAVLLAAVNLRPAIASVPPIIDAVRGTFGLSASAAGVLTAVPVVCMGLFAPAAAWAAARWGTSRTMALALALLTVATAVRPLAGIGLLYTATVLVGVAIAVGGALMPALVRDRFPDRVGPITGLYTTALISGALIGSGGTEPLRAALGGSWQAALALWAVPAALALVVWLVVRPAAAPRRPVVAASGGWSPWRDRDAWMVTLYMGGQSLLYYAPLAWLAARYTELGWSAARAGGLLALFSATQVVAALVAPALARRDPRPAIVVGLLLAIGCLALIGVSPLSAPALWAGLLGIGVGANFSLALTVVGQIAPTPADTPRASGMAFFVGYLLASLGPVAVGFLHDLTGGFRVPYLVLVPVGLATLAAGLAAGGVVNARR
ncbi:MFS transporter [Asanoa ishikariensis]|uniref:MFS transporter, CP family, cyanate transporter n=1 Tax=Asanoa ishikariensis TaxID=137265 RepID=A0A1H3R5N6_9ACTN|nr:MFS transporter [Asanoa ishikariensis]GIF64388.1 MFS transporter [Asanoa ishikariensis]SDZ20997.1 MFS transporter, CP family, cyanate transporter [Asanoa ishikariensis]